MEHTDPRRMPRWAAPPAERPGQEVAMTQGPLHGVRILELSIILSAPFGGMHLSDLGAAVIKVEPLTGDTIRNPAGGIPGSSKFFQVLNRGRRGLSIDLTHPE